MKGVSTLLALHAPIQFSHRSTKHAEASAETMFYNTDLHFFILCLKNDSDITHYNFDAHQPTTVILAKILLRKYAIKLSFVIPPVLTNVSTLPGETWTPEIVSFQLRCIPCFENDTAFGTCCRLRLLLGRTSISAMAERARELGDFKKARVNGGTNNHSLNDSHKSLRCRWQTRIIW